MAENPFDPASAPASEPVEVTQNAFVHWNSPDARTSDYAARRYEYVWKHRHIVKTWPVAADGYVSGTVDVPVGDCTLALYLVRQSDSARFLCRTLTVRVRPDVRSESDDRPHPAIMVAKIEALLEGRADSDVLSYTIGGRQVSKMSVSELISWRNHYRAELQQLKASEDIAAGKNRNNVITVRFT